ncbi:Hypothetical protein CINCED_3A010364 [Cinara cedri]|uniref:Uncharacterized protein n=1 Tax=Cinara cedri TaxID=506608 RepID=A0A5E4N0A6_9HEMI|nr:Hypothetical protein CINCED_3A010364 [Cinara cedri]
MNLIRPILNKISENKKVQTLHEGSDEGAGNNNCHNEKLIIIHFVSKEMEKLVDTPHGIEYLISFIASLPKKVITGSGLVKNFSNKTNKLDEAVIENDFYYEKHKDTKSRHKAQYEQIKQGGFLPLLFAGIGAASILAGEISSIENTIIERKHKIAMEKEQEKHIKEMEKIDNNNKNLQVESGIKKKKRYCSTPNLNKYDDHIIRSQYKTYEATSETNFNRDGDVITFEIEGSDSFLSIKHAKYNISGKYIKNNNTEYEANSNVQLNDNFVVQISVIKNGTLIDQIENVGRSSIIKECVSYSLDENGSTINSGFQSRFTGGGRFKAVGNLYNLCLGFFKDIKYLIFKGGIKINFKRAKECII